MAVMNSTIETSIGDEAPKGFFQLKVIECLYIHEKKKKCKINTHQNVM